MKLGICFSVFRNLWLGCNHAIEFTRHHMKQSPRSAELWCMFLGDARLHCVWVGQREVVFFLVQIVQKGSSYMFAMDALLWWLSTIRDLLLSPQVAFLVVTRWLVWWWCRVNQKDVIVYPKMDSSCFHLFLSTPENLSHWLQVVSFSLWWDPFHLCHCCLASLGPFFWVRARPWAEWKKWIEGKLTVRNFTLGTYFRISEE